MSRLLTIFVVIALIMSIYSIYSIYELRLSYDTILRDYERLSRKYEEVSSQSQELERELLMLKENFSKIRILYEGLLVNYSSLNASYTSMKEDYENLKLLMRSIRRRSLPKPEEIPEILRELLSQPPELKSYILKEFNISKDDQPAVKAEKVLTWIMNTLQYIPDDYHKVIMNNDVLTIKDYASSPIETLGRGGGDCEDLAILSYAALTSALGDGESVYLIRLEGRRTIPGIPHFAHVAVLYKIGNRFIIVDPAGLYVTDVSYTLEIVVRKQVDGDIISTTVHLNPLSISPDLKFELMNEGLAKLVIASGSSVEAKPAEEAIYRWTRMWEKRIPLAYVNLIANSTFYKRFDSTKEFLAFVKRGGLS